MLRHIDWEFPLPRTHAGMMLGNATTGLLVWGEGDHLKITIGRADLWDHRGGMPPWTEKQNYRAIKACLDANDAAGIKSIFACATENVPGQPTRPSVIPVGRLDLRLGAGATLERGRIDSRTGVAEIFYSRGGRELAIRLQISMESQLFLLELSEDGAELVSVPSWEFKGEYLKSISFEPPRLLKDAGLKGWTQALPSDPGVCVAAKFDGKRVWMLTERGSDMDALAQDAKGKLSAAIAAGVAKFDAANLAWWGAYWKDIPAIEIPNAKLDLLYVYGLYKFAAFTNPSGVPATLQGPWIEEYEMPPWSSDYHFNINVQMCYWPAFKANRLEHLRPMFDMVWGWRERLALNAKAFVGIDDGLMLPHAVDDHCVCMGSFWTGTIDHACSAWIAQMMYSYCQYTGDTAYLREVVFPFMKGVMRVYEEMLELRDGKYVLPVSVSPEYRGAEMNAWGANASFQLAAIHRLCEDLVASAAQLDQKPAPVWGEILTKLPKATLFEDKDDSPRFGLWEGTDLEESHRHHSHLGSICPFDTIDIYSPDWVKTVNNSVHHWVREGNGLWSGWCVPWASMLHSRLGNGEAAETLLEIFGKYYANEGHGTLHDATCPGFTCFGGPTFRAVNTTPRREIMQMDGGMGSLTAVQDMLMHSRRGVVHIFPGVPRSWKDASFKDMPCEGGFMVSAVRSRRSTAKVTVAARRAGKLLLGNPWADAKAKLKFSDGSASVLEGATLSVVLAAGASCEISKA